MSLQIGQHLGSYEITALLGKGGMGEVYRARDTKLKRDVAIKILPDEFSRDPERVNRFQREAQVLASLNHPNIAQIYGLEDSTAQRCIVMELVEGDTLAERLKRGPIPLDEALQIAKQVAEALEAAHDRGVIHRDLKPANLKLTHNGTVKVLDFGLAKVREPQAAVDLSNSATLLLATTPGIIMGTAAYMSPEQAKGLSLDRRTDIFAFGCVLYEMLTGRPAFHGVTASDILACVLKIEPDWDRLPKNTPPTIRHLLMRCLQKDQNWRMQTAGDVRIEIAEGRTHPDVSEWAVPSPRSRTQLAWIFAVLLFVIAGALAVLYFRAPVETPEMRVAIMTPSTTDPLSFAISPDGRKLVYVASGDGPQRLWLRPLDALTAQPLPGTEGASYPFWSPDSRSIAFFGGGKLKRIDIGGNLPQTLADALLPRGGTWSPEGVILYAPTVGLPLVRIPASGGEAVNATKLDPPLQSSHRFPHFLPGGRKFLFYSQGTPDTQGLYLGELNSAKVKRLTAADTAGAYAPPGWMLFIRRGALLEQRFDTGRGVLSGDPLTVAEPVAFDDFFAGAFSVSAAGPIAYRPAGTSRRQLVWFERSGKAISSLGRPDEGLSNPELSLDGRRVAVDRLAQNNQDIWLLDATRTVRFTFDANSDRFPLWSPDASRIVFSSYRKGFYDLYYKHSSELNVKTSQKDKKHVC
jgi:eukaryotic-like serine/threonine-protein kinase